PEGVSGGSPAKMQARSGQKQKEEEQPGFGVVADVTDDTHNALPDDDDLELGVHVSLDALVEEGGVEPVGVGAVGELLVAEDRWVFEELLLRVLEMDLGAAEEGG